MIFIARTDNKDYTKASIIYNPPWRRFTFKSRKELLEDESDLLGMSNKIESALVPLARKFAEKGIIISPNSHLSIFSNDIKLDDSIDMNTIPGISVDTTWYTVDKYSKGNTFVPMRIFICNENNNISSLTNAIAKGNLSDYSIKLRYAYPDSNNALAFTDVFECVEENQPSFYYVLESTFYNKADIDGCESINCIQCDIYSLIDIYKWIDIFM